MTARRRRPVIGSAVKRTPALWASTIRCTTTASRSPCRSTPCVSRYATARSFQSDAQHLRTASISASSPLVPRIVSCCPAKLASGRSSAVADERTATGGEPRARYASRTASAMPTGTGDAIRRTRALAGASGATPAASAASAYALVPMTNPSGTGNPARMSSPRFAPLPPATGTSAALRSASGRMNADVAATAVMPPARRCPRSAEADPASAPARPGRDRRTGGAVGRERAALCVVPARSPIA